MEVIFLENVKGQAKKGDIKKVKDGYAMNFLIKNKLAVAKTDKGIEILNKERQEEQAQDEKLKEQALKTKEKLDKEVLNFKLKAGDKDKVFGSVSTKQIKEELDKLGYSINKNQISVSDTLSTLGIYNVDINLYKKIKATIKIKITK